MLKLPPNDLLKLHPQVFSPYQPPEYAREVFDVRDVVDLEGQAYDVENFRLGAYVEIKWGRRRPDVPPTYYVSQRCQVVGRIAYSAAASAEAVTLAYSSMLLTAHQHRPRGASVEYLLILMPVEQEEYLQAFPTRSEIAAVTAAGA